MERYKRKLKISQVILTGRQNRFTYSGVVNVDFGENPEIRLNVWCSGVVPECVDRPKDPENERIRIVAFQMLVWTLKMTEYSRTSNPIKLATKSKNLIFHGDSCAKINEIWGIVWMITNTCYEWESSKRGNFWKTVRILFIFFRKNCWDPEFFIEYIWITLDFQRAKKGIFADFDDNYIFFDYFQIPPSYLMVI